MEVPRLGLFSLAARRSPRKPLPRRCGQVMRAAQYCTGICNRKVRHGCVADRVRAAVEARSVGVVRSALA